ncbi:hypothetical protein A9L51_23270 [Klebsiella pneumoniae]|nr:hypothetical protein A9L51_23270 [Klebsiella pneumoniae]
MFAIIASPNSLHFSMFSAFHQTFEVIGHGLAAIAPSMPLTIRSAASNHCMWRSNIYAIKI